ncbi:MAG TPA: T9SS type A sorting domain-containing protein, partial [Chitinophagales bacterium]|nr:T9SS type A sorting domain-containing protein [Chitinophagales bacterium]
ASTNNGLKISNDGGTTWTNPSGIGNPANADSYEVTVGGNGVVYAEINFNYYRSTDGINFTNMTGTDGFPASGIGRIEFAVSPQDANYVYSVVSESGWSGGLKAILRSTDAGLTWSPLISAGSETFNPLGEQGTWNIALGIDPLNKDRIFVGGQLELWIYFHGGWNQVASAFGESPDNPYYVHADMHGIYFHPANNNIMFVISDGGIFKTYNATQQFPTFTMRNKGYTATQFYGITASDIGYTMGGSQDNGTQLIDLKGNTRRTADEVSGGDGGDCEISSINPNALFASTYNAQAYRSSNGGESFGDFYDNNLDRDNDGSIDQGSLFVMASFLWEKDNSTQTINGGDTLIIEDKRSVYFLGANGRLWFTTEALNFSSQSYWYDVDVSGTVTEVEVSHDGVIFCGTKNGNVYRIDGLYNKFKPDTIEAESTPTKTIIRYIPDFPEPSRPDPLRNYAGWDWPIYTSANADTNTYQGLKRTRISRNATWGSRYVTGIAVDPNDNNHVVVTLGSYGNTTYVYRTTNSNVLYPTFTGIQNDLPRMPVYDAIIDYYNSNNIILATELGIWASSDLGAGWNEENAGMASVPTLKLFQRKLYENGCQVIYAGTHGRGIFRTTTLTANGCKLIPGELPTGISEVKEVSQLQVYPNPVYEKAIVEFDVKDENSLVSLHVIDLLGRIHKNEKFANFSPGANQLEVGFNDIPAGVYMIVLQSGKTTESKRVFVTK